MLLRRILFVFCFSSLALADSRPALEYKVKAAYLYNFTKFITWPDKHRDTFNFCVIGADYFLSLLKPLEQRTALDKPIHLLRLDSIEQAGQCHILYIDNDRLLPAQPDLPLPSGLTDGTLEGVLTVSSHPFFARRGGMIGFVVRDGRIKLQVNLDEFKKNGLKISAKLMEVAELVKGENHE